MRACAACLYGRFPSDAEETGECWNRPPIVVSVPISDPRMADHYRQTNSTPVELLSVRPTIARSEFCHFFYYRKSGE